MTPAVGSSPPPALSPLRIGQPSPLGGSALTQAIRFQMSTSSLCNDFIATNAAPGAAPPCVPCSHPPWAACLRVG